MKEIELPYFGKINLEIDDDLFETKVKLNNYPLTIDSNFSEVLTEQEWIEKLQEIAPHIAELNTKFEKLIESYSKIAESEDESVNTVIDFKDFHNNDIDDDHLLKTIKSQAKDSSNIMTALRVVRIGLNEEDMTWDYIFPNPDDNEDTISLSDQILVVNCSHKGEIDSISWES